MTASTTVLDEARARSAQGWHLHPLHYITDQGGCSCGDPECPPNSHGKHPRYNGWQHAPRPTDRDLARWFGPGQRWQSGLLTGQASGVVVLDVDPRNGGDETLSLLERQYGPLPHTVESVTGQRGRHIFLAHVGPLPSVKLGPGLELKADDTQVVLPPSHSGFGPYVWDAMAHPDDVPVAPLPDWVRQLAEASARTTGGAPPLPNKIPAGERNATLTSLAGTMRRRGAGEAAIFAALTVENDERCDPPLPEREVRRIAQSVARYAPEPTVGGFTNGHRAEDVPPAEADGEPERKRFAFTTPAEILTRPAPERLVDDFLLVNSTSMTFGDSESLKSFIMLDVSLSIAGGWYWQGRKVKQGPVVYIYAEGGADLHLRLQAWSKAHGRPLPETLYFVEEAVHFLEPGDVDVLLERIAELPIKPVLIVIDTLARMTTGGDENSTKDMGLFVEALEHLRRATRANVNVIHHTNRQGELRGSSSLRAGLDTVVEVKRDDDLVTITCDKQKGMAPFRPIRLEMDIIDLDEFWHGESSVVLHGLVSNRADTFTPQMRLVAETLVDTFGQQGATSTQWETVCGELKIGRATYFRAKKTLQEQGFVATDRDGRGAHYQPTVALLQKLEGLKRDGETFVRRINSEGIKVSPPLRGVRPDTETETFAAETLTGDDTPPASAFVPTDEWQPFPDGAAAPPGCVFRVNMTTGEREARLDANPANPPNRANPTDKEVEF